MTATFKTGMDRQRDYRPPTVTSHGRVGDVTLSHTALFGAKLATAFIASVVNSPSSGNGPVTNNGPTIVNNLPPARGPVPGGSETITSIHGGGGTAPGIASSTPGGAGGANGAGGAVHGAAHHGGKLPFTGLPIVYLSGAGAAMIAAGEAVRRVARSRTGDA